MNDNDRYALFLELTNLMHELGHGIKGASLDDHGMTIETRKDDAEVRLWVSVKKAE